MRINQKKMSVLSAVIITYNEEKNIERCINSLLDVADEIVIVDSLSDDRTREICMQFPVQFYEQPFLGYVEQKNFALQKARMPCVLCIDADEALSETLKNEIIAEKKKGFPKDAYSMNRLNFYCGTWMRHGSFYPDKKLRLFKKAKGRWGGMNPHDKVLMDPGTEVKHLKGDLLHYSYTTYEAHRQKTERFSTIGAEALLKNGASPTYLSIIINPAFRFLKEYFIKLGFLDGKNGFMAAYYSSMQAHLKYRKYFALKKTICK